MTDKYINSATFYSVEILVEKEGDTTDIQSYERINQFDTQEQAEYFVLNMCDKRTPANFYANCDTGQKVVKIMECVFFLGAVAWLVGKLPTPNFNFLMGAVSCACMSYEYHLTKKNRKILSAELPKGVVNEHTR